MSETVDDYLYATLFAKLFVYLLVLAVLVDRSPLKHFQEVQHCQYLLSDQCVLQFRLLLVDPCLPLDPDHLWDRVVPGFLKNLVMKTLTL